jgi:ATP-dependent Clp protease ATP-binding subunit ClpB
VVVFRSLKESHLRQILELELQAVQERVTACASTKFVFRCSDAAKDVLLWEGIDVKYGARHLKRSVERFLVSPLSNLVASGQVGTNDLIYVDVSPETGSFTFSKRSDGLSVCDTADLTAEPESDESRYGVVGILLPQTKAASVFC